MRHTPDRRRCPASNPGTIRRRTQRPAFRQGAPVVAPTRDGVGVRVTLEGARFRNPAFIDTLKPLAGRLPRPLAPDEGRDGEGTSCIPPGPRSGFAGVGKRS